MKRYGIIMAGGSGTRFWPLSRRKMPKQFLNVTGKDAMVNETIDRLFPVIEKEDIFIVTGKDQAELTDRTVNGRLSKSHILAEPAARNTAACVGYAAMELIRKYGDGIMGIFSSDHYIKDQSGYRAEQERAVEDAEISGIRELSVEQRHVCLESICYPETVRKAFARYLWVSYGNWRKYGDGKGKRYH